MALRLVENEFPYDLVEEWADPVTPGGKRTVLADILSGKYPLENARSDFLQWEKQQDTGEP